MVRFFQQVELFVYRHASALTVICDTFARIIEAKGIASSKISVIPNFVDTEEMQPGPKSNSLSTELGLSNKFVVLYAGNLGKLQNIDTLLEAAKNLQSNTEAVFLIVGDGAKRSSIEAQVYEQNLDNVILMPYQPWSHMPAFYAASDICYVSLMAGTGQTAAPSKLYAIMASGRPALVAIDEDSDLVHTVHSAQCGITVEPNDVKALQSALSQAIEHQEDIRRLGQNGRRYAEENLARPIISARYHALIQQLTTHEQ